MQLKPICWQESHIKILDQRQLPEQEVYLNLHKYAEMVEAIKTLAVRGAPLIGVSGAMGVALASFEFEHLPATPYFDKMLTAKNELYSARPTAVNLMFGVQKLWGIFLQNKFLPPKELSQLLKLAAQEFLETDIQTNKKLGEHGACLLNDEDTVLTHCNAGALATAGFGTALGVIYAAKNQGKNIRVFADETRPVLQGARLTAWELQKHQVETTLICDNMAGAVMQSGQIHKVIVGADRIAKNGDTANKIGTYSVAILAKYHDIPFYVAAPFSTIDLQTPTGKQIIIEERDHTEITKIGTKSLAPNNIFCFNPAFDVTPANLISGFITEKGIFTAPYSFSNP